MTTITAAVAREHHAPLTLEQLELDDQLGPATLHPASGRAVEARTIPAGQTRQDVQARRDQRRVRRLRVRRDGQAGHRLLIRRADGVDASWSAPPWVRRES